MTKSLSDAAYGRARCDFHTEPPLPALLLTVAGLAALLTFGILQAALAQDVPGPERPNILFIAIDDLRPELPPYGYNSVHAPNVSRLAAGGVTFTRAYAQQAVCSPSRTSLMTGLRPDSTHVYGLETHFRETVPEVVTLPQHFRGNGYFATWWGKIYHAWLLDSLSWSEEGGNQSRRLEPEWPEENWRAYALEESNRYAEAHDGFGPIYERADLPDDAYPDGLVADSAVAELQRLEKRDEPFFLAVGFYKPHVPWTVPERYWRFYETDSLDLPPSHVPPSEAPEHAVNGWGHIRRYGRVGDEKPLSTRTLRELRHAYYAAISYIDAQVGKVLDELERLGLSDDTIVVLWGDHGFKLGEYGAWAKFTNFEIDTRVPLIISAPWLPHQGAKADALVELVDLYPTLAEMANLPVPSHLQGTSQVPVLKDPNAHVDDVALSQYPRALDGDRQVMGRTMRTDRYRYTAWENRETGEVVSEELYDHASDPRENYNVAGEEAYQDTAAKLRQRLRKEWSQSLK